MVYMYRINMGKAILNKGGDYPLKIIGQFKNDTVAKDACLRHYEKACKALSNLGKPTPAILFF